MLNAHRILLALSLALATTALVAADLDDNCEVNECVEAVQEVTLPDGTVRYTNVAVLTGTCNDAKGCAKKAKKWCKKHGHGIAVSVAINSEETECSFSCADGTKTSFTCPKPGTVASVEPEPAISCSIGTPIQDGCMLVEHELYGTGDSREGISFEHFEPMSMQEALTRGAGYGTILFPTIEPTGTCTDVKDCARAANKGCAAAGAGKAKKVSIRLDGESCSYSCTGGGFDGVIVCATKPKENN